MNSDVGWIPACVVHKDFQNQGIGTLLLNRAEEALFESGVNKMHVGRDLWHYFPGVPASYTKAMSWLAKKENRSGEKEYDLLTPLHCSKCLLGTAFSTGPGRYRTSWS